MENKKILKLTLEENGYNLLNYIYPADGLIMAISEPIDRCISHHLDKFAEDVKSKEKVTTDPVGYFNYRESESERTHLDNLSIDQALKDYKLKNNIL